MSLTVSSCVPFASCRWVDEGDERRGSGNKVAGERSRWQMVLEPVERLELLPLCFASLYLPCHMPPHARARVMADATEENASDDDAVKMGRHGVTRGKLSVAEHSAGAGAHDGAAAAAAAAARLLPAAPAAHVCAGAGSAAGLLSAPASRTAWRARGALSSACFKVLKVRRHAAARLCAGHDTGLCERWTVGAALGLDALLWRGPRGVEHFCCVAARSCSSFHQRLVLVS